MQRGRYTDTPLAQWLLRELERRNLSARQASIEAGLNHGAISHYLVGNRPSVTNAAKLARYFEVPEEFIYQLAGIIEPPPDHDLFVKQLAELTQGWSEADKQALVEVARAWDRRRTEPR